MGFIVRVYSIEVAPVSFGRLYMASTSSICGCGTSVLVYQVPPKVPDVSPALPRGTGIPNEKRVREGIQGAMPHSVGAYTDSLIMPGLPCALLSRLYRDSKRRFPECPDPANHVWCLPLCHFVCSVSLGALCVYGSRLISPG